MCFFYVGWSRNPSIKPDKGLTSRHKVKKPVWRNAKLAGRLQPLHWWLQGYPSADCLVGNEAVMFLTVMERLSSRWQQDMTAGMTHIQQRAQSQPVDPTHGRLNWRSAGFRMRRRFIGWCQRQGFIWGEVRWQSNKQQWLMAVLRRMGNRRGAIKLRHEQVCTMYLRHRVASVKWWN